MELFLLIIAKVLKSPIPAGVAEQPASQQQVSVQPGTRLAAELGQAVSR